MDKRSYTADKRYSEHTHTHKKKKKCEQKNTDASHAKSKEFTKSTCAQIDPNDLYIV